MPPPPDMPPPPPVIPPVSAAPRVDPYVAPKPDPSISMDGEVASGSATEAAFDTRLIGALIDVGVGIAIYIVFSRISSGLALLAELAYFFVRDALPFLDGQSVGKKLMKTKAVDLNGKSLSGNWQASIVRNISWIIPFFPFVEIYILNKKKSEGQPLRRFGDEWAKTKVVIVPETPPAA